MDYSLDCLSHLTKMSAIPIYGKTKICSIISCSWPWPFVTLLRRSGERLRTFRSSSYLFFSTCLINSIIHKRSCKILYKTQRKSTNDNNYWEFSFMRQWDHCWSMVKLSKICKHWASDWGNSKHEHERQPCYSSRLQTHVLGAQGLCV